MGKVKLDFWGGGENQAKMSMEVGDDDDIVVPYSGRQKGMGALTLFLLLLGLCALAIQFTGTSDDFFENLDTFVNSFGDDFERLPPAAVAAKRAVKNVGKKVSEKVEELVDKIPIKEALYNDDMFANPYWYLPNPLGKDPKPMQRPMSAAEKSRFLADLNHQYVYQAYKAMRQLRLLRLKGSETVFAQGLKHHKFWVRMEALIGLAEMGIPVSKETVGGVFEGARSSLIKNHFYRMKKDPSPGEKYIMLQSIKLVNGAGRLRILKNLSEHGFKDSKLYLAAATLDPENSIQRWLAGELRRRSLSDRFIETYKKTIADSYFTEEKEEENIESEKAEE